MPIDYIKHLREPNTVSLMLDNTCSGFSPPFGREKVVSHLCYRICCDLSHLLKSALGRERFSLQTDKFSSLIDQDPSKIYLQVLHHFYGIS